MQSVLSVQTARSNVRVGGRETRPVGIECVYARVSMLTPSGGQSSIRMALSEANTSRESAREKTIYKYSTNSQMVRTGRRGGLLVVHLASLLVVGGCGFGAL